jgi:hypothetical protein
MKKATAQGLREPGFSIISSPILASTMFLVNYSAATSHIMKDQAAFERYHAYILAHRDVLEPYFGVRTTRTRLSFCGRVFSAAYSWMPNSFYPIFIAMWPPTVKKALKSRVGRPQGFLRETGDVVMEEIDNKILDMTIAGGGRKRSQSFFNPGNRGETRDQRIHDFRPFPR